MPIVSRPARNLSPLEEEGQPRALSMEDEDREMEDSQFVSIGLSILTSRQYEGSHTPGQDPPSPSASSLQDSEVFLPITQQSLSAMRQQMYHLWRQGVPMCIEVKGQATPNGGKGNEEMSSVLLERWTVHVTPRRSQPHPTTPRLLLQAIHSFLHFSQIRSWIVSHRSLPFDLVYRVCAPGEEKWDQLSVAKDSVHHVFPPASLPQHSSLQVSVTHLPRLPHIPRNLLPKCAEQLKHAHNHPVRTKLHSEKEGRRGVDEEIGESLLGVASAWSKQAQHPGSSSSLPEDLLKRTSELHITSRTSQKSSDIMSSSKLNIPGSAACPRDHGFPFSPPQPSPLSPKLLAGLGDQAYGQIVDVGTLRARGTRSRGEESVGDRVALSNEEDAQRQVVCGRGSNGEEEEGRGGGRDEQHYCRQRFCFEGTCVGQDGGDNGSSLQAPATHSSSVRVPSSTPVPRLSGPSPSPASRHGASNGAGPTVVYRRSGSCAYPSSGARLPDSPIPFAGQRRVGGNSPRRRSAAINIKAQNPPRPPLRSNSAPVIVPSLCLLGTFEESVLNGRIEPCGYVEGFTAELGASGSFCPRHVSLPVTAAFFSLAEDGGTSPYLGHIDLSNVGKRGYHVPKKGTVQLTLFNPNKTVVKIFVVTYDFSDMPPRSQTFLRQKTVSRPYHSAQLLPGLRALPALQYLIHLRFICSKSGRVYLHTDIRLIFARRAPDTDPDLSKLSLYTTTEGPSDPKYGPADSGR